MESNKNRAFLSLFALFLGFFGVDRFYAGGKKNIILGVLKLFFGWATFGIWVAVDIILAVSGKMKDQDGNAITSGTW